MLKRFMEKLPSSQYRIFGDAYFVRLLKIILLLRTVHCYLEAWKQEAKSASAGKDTLLSLWKNSSRKG